MKMPCRNERAGFALLMVLFALVAMIMVFSSVMFWLSSSVKQTAENNIYTSSEAAAEGATEMAFAQMDRDFNLSALSPASSYTQLLPTMTGWPVQYTFSGTNSTDHPGNIYINEGSPSQDLEPLGNEYANLQGIIQSITITATATPQGTIYTNPATVTQVISFATIPAFQFAIFYNINLEIDPAHNMPIAGPVFSNGGIWSGTGNLTYNSAVEAAGQVTISGTDPFLTSKSDSGTPQANFPTGQPVSTVTPLEIPIGASTNNSSTNVIAIIQIPPSSVAAPQAIAYAQSNACYTYNRANLIVSNWSNGTHQSTPIGNNFAVYLQDPWNGPSWYAPSTGHLNQLTNDFYIVTYSNKTTHVISTIYTTLSSVFPVLPILLLLLCFH